MHIVQASMFSSFSSKSQTHFCNASFLSAEREGAATAVFCFEIDMRILKGFDISALPIRQSCGGMIVMKMII